MSSKGSKSPFLHRAANGDNKRDSKCLENRKIHLEHSGQLAHSFHVSVAFLIVNFPSTVLFIQWSLRIFVENTTYYSWKFLLICRMLYWIKQKCSPPYPVSQNSLKEPLHRTRFQGHLCQLHKNINLVSKEDICLNYTKIYPEPRIHLRIQFHNSQEEIKGTV